MSVVILCALVGGVRKPLRSSAGLLLADVSGTYRVNHDWSIANWNAAYRVESPIDLNQVSGWASYVTRTNDWRDGPDNYLSGVVDRYRISLTLKYQSGVWVWAGTMTAYDYAEGGGFPTTKVTAISRTCGADLGPAGTYEIGSTTGSGSGVTVGTTFEVIRV